MSYVRSHGALGATTSNGEQLVDPAVVAATPGYGAYTGQFVYELSSEFPSLDFASIAKGTRLIDAITSGMLTEQDVRAGFDVSASFPNPANPDEVAAYKSFLNSDMTAWAPLDSSAFQTEVVQPAMAQAAADVAAQTAPTGPAHYLVDGIHFDETGVVYSSSSDGTLTPTGQTLTTEQLQSLMTTETLPADAPLLPAAGSATASISAPSGGATDAGTGSIPSSGTAIAAATTPPLSATIVTEALAAIANAGGDVRQPTQIIDQSGYVIGVAQQQQDGSIAVSVPSQPSRSISSIVQSVTGWIDGLAGTIQNIGTEIKKVGNAVQGGAAGAQTGYNLPTTSTPYLVAGAGVIALLLLTSRRR
jgi:hypothetical protein